MHQPDIGRKIRKDANVVASLICTLPREIAPDDTAAVDAMGLRAVYQFAGRCGR